jgi:protoporphyrinogen IX oxidase
MSDLYSVSKALHLVGAISWMAGLFYLVRIMVYHAEAAAKPDAERRVLEPQFSLMEWKAYRIILQPAVIITWSFGCVMLSVQPAWLHDGWLHGKLFFLLLLTGYTHYCKSHIKALENGSSTFTHLHYRVLNEIPTILMVGILFLAVFKQRINWWYLGAGILLFTALILSAVKKVNRKQG